MHKTFNEIYLKPMSETPVYKDIARLSRRLVVYNGVDGKFSLLLSIYSNFAIITSILTRC